jgi:uncharacterized ion transporter superfamily protein YfcC
VTTLRFPHPLTLLLACILLAAALTYVIPGGAYDRRDDPATGRSVVVGGTYHRVEANRIGPLQAALAIPKGIIDAADVIATVFLVGGAFAVIDRTGALRVLVGGLARRLRRREALAIPICCVVFATGGALENMQEEIIALVPVLVLLVTRLGFDNLTAVAMSTGAAAIGASFSPMNPFQVGIAQTLAEVPALSGGMFRIAVLLIALAVWIAWTTRYARRARGSIALTDESVSAELPGPAPQADADLGAGRTTAILLLVVVGFGLYVFGVTRLGWGFNELSAVLFMVGLLGGLVGRLGVNGTAEAYVHGFREMAFAALLIGFARAIYVVLNEGRIIDTIVHGLFTPLAGLPDAFAAVGMMVVHTAVHVPVPSVSGQAVLTMPILVPLSDLLGIARQVTILAYQYGAGLCEVLTPTNGALMAVLAAAGVRYDQWMRFVLPLWAMLFALGAVAVLVAIAIGLS